MNSQIIKAGMVVLTLVSLVFAFDINDMEIDDPDARYWGLSLLQVSSGSGINTFFEYALRPSLHLVGAVSLMSMKGEYEYPMLGWDYNIGYFEYYKADRKRLWLMPAHIGIKRMLFTDEIANNFRPYLEINTGPVVAFDPPNLPEFKDRVKNIKTYLTLSTRIGGGVDFLYGPQTLVSVYAGYDISTFRHLIDDSYYVGANGERMYTDNGKKDYSSIVVSIGFGKKF